MLFLHGWVGSWRYWIPAMQEASKSFRAYALDLWGFGNTARDPDQYDLGMQVSLLDRFLMAMGIARIALIGHGLGAVISLLFSRRFPGLVDRIMAVDCPLHRQAIHNRLVETPLFELAEWLSGKNSYSEPVRTDASRTDPHAITRSLENWQVFGYEPSILDEMRTPCLLVHGENDPLVKLPGDEFVSSLPVNIHCIILEQSGHFPMLDGLQKFNNLLVDFLALESGSTPRELQLKEEWRRRMR